MVGPWPAWIRLRSSPMRGVGAPGGQAGDRGCPFVPAYLRNRAYQFWLSHEVVLYSYATWNGKAPAVGADHQQLVLIKGECL